MATFTPAPQPATILNEPHKEDRGQKSANMLKNVHVPPRERKLQLDGGPKDYTFIVPITAELVAAFPIADQITLREGLFNRKKEFHLTLFGFGDRATVETYLKAGTDKVDPKRLEELNTALSETDFSFTIAPDTLRVVTNLEYNAVAVEAGTSFESEHTIIVDADVPQMKTFFARVQALGLGIQQPEAHITLFVKDNGKATGLGIAITKYEEQLKGEAKPKISVRSLEF